MDLESIEVEHSPVCRPGSDCWDVKLHFFFPARQVQTVRKVYRFTVDVSDVVPVTVGPVRSWFVREVDFGVAVSDVFSDVEVQSMKLPKSVPGVTRGMSALSGYIGQVGVEPSYSSCRWVGTAPFLP